MLRALKERRHRVESIRPFSIDFSVPPNPPVIVNEAGREATSQLGPYPEGASAEISCEVSGGKLYRSKTCSLNEK